MNTCPFSPRLEQSQIPWVGVSYCLGQGEINPYFTSPCLIGYQIGARVGRKSIRPLRVYRLPFPLTGRLVGRMQYAPTFPEKDKGSLGMRFPLSRTMADQYVFHSSMSNRLSDRYPGRGVLHTLFARLSSTLSPLTERLVGRMQYAPTLSKKEEVSLGRCFLLSLTMADKYVFHFFMSNRLSDRYPSRGILHTPHIDSTSTPTPFAGRLVRRIQYAPTLPTEKSDLKGWCEVMFGARRDEYVFHFFMSNRLSDRYPGRAQKHTPLNHSRKGYSIARQTIWGRMQYAPTLPAEKSDLMGWWEGMFWEKGEEYVFHFSMSNRLLDRYPGRGVLHTPLAHLSSTLSSFAGRLVGRMQYAPTLPEKDEVSSCRCFPLSRTIRDKSVFLFSMSNWLSDRYPGRAQKHTPLARLSSTPTPFAGRLVGRMQYAPILSEKDKVSSGRCFPLSRTMVDKYVSFFSMSNRLSDRYPCRGVLHTPHIDLTSTLSPFAGRLVGRMLLRPTLPAEKSDFKGCCGVMFGTRRDEYVFHFSMSNRLSDRYPGRGAKAYAPCAFIVYPFAPCGRLVGRMLLRPYIVGKR